VARSMHSRERLQSKRPGGYMDIVTVVLAAAFFAATWGLIALCDRL